MLEQGINRITELAGQSQKPEILKVPHPDSGKDLTYLITRNHQGGMNTTNLTDDLAQLDPNPLRRKGTARFETLDSFIDHANRFQNVNSALFATKQAGNISIECVIDYHDRVNDAEGTKIPQANPQHGNHRGLHTFPLSDEFVKWLEVSNNDDWMDPVEFSYFLEDNIIDVMFLPDFLSVGGKESDHEADKALKQLIQKLEGKPCGPDKLMNLAKGLQVNENTITKAYFDRHTGQTSIGFESEHQDQNGQKLDVPNMFLICIPIFNGDSPYRIPVRLRYRARGKTVVWKMEMHRPDVFLEDAFRLACGNAAKETGLPLFYGQPE